MLNPKMPILDQMVWWQTLSDSTNIFTFRNTENGKFGIVIDNQYDTVIRFIFENELESTTAAIIKANDTEDYLNLLIQKYPEIKAFYPCFPASEPGDLVWIKFMTGNEIMTDKAMWISAFGNEWKLQIRDACYSLDELRIFQLRWPKDLLTEEFYDMPDLSFSGELDKKTYN